MHHFRYWCYHVLPLVYDDSLSYYEVLCKVVKYINDLIDQDKIFGEQLEGLKSDMVEVQKWIDDFDTGYAERIIREHLATMIFPEINSDGYIVYNIPDTWDSLEFATTGLDYTTELCPEYGHLVLIY